MNIKRNQEEMRPLQFKLSGEIDIIKYATIDKCNDNDNICEIKFFNLPNFVIKFDNKDTIVYLIDYFKSE